MALYISPAKTNAKAFISVTSRVSFGRSNTQIMSDSESKSLQRPTALQGIEDSVKDCMLYDLQALSLCLMRLYKNTTLLRE